ncbi:hypothetical protein VP01_9096g1 [Puccinia sorghi]|uniref:Uncharacterized protein n=1 Tax=Puccinia sorghi TaxID=27349 RepID=A0A0L6U9R7_9BASI|nr:hypothetical protein VP01_9096g1 [Puccinia sorghi]
MLNLIDLLLHNRITGEWRKMKRLSLHSNIPTIADMAWACLWRSQNNRELITTMGVDVLTFEALLHQFAN